MKILNKYNWLLWALALAAAVLACVMLAPRYAAERNNRTYDIVADYKDFHSMAAFGAPEGSSDADWWLELLREQGIEKVALYESTLETLGDDFAIPVDTWTVEELRETAGWESGMPAEITERVLSGFCKNDVVAACYRSDDLKWITDALEERAEGLEWVTAEQDGVGYLYLSDPQGREVKKFSLGFWPDTVDRLRDAGMTILPRSAAVEGLNGSRFAEAALRSMDEINSNPPYFFPTGDALPGYDDPEAGHDRLLAYLQQRDTALIVTEQQDQSGNESWGGLEALAEETGYDVVRMFFEFNYIQYRYAYYSYAGPEEITNSLFRAVQERNCRVIYLRAIFDTDNIEKYITDPAEYVKLISDLRTRLEDQQQMTLGTVTPMQEVTQPFALRLLVGIGAIAAAVLLLSLLAPLRPLWQWILWALGSVGVAGAMVVMPESSKLLLSIGGGIAYPSLTMLCLLHTVRGQKNVPSAFRIWPECIGGMLLCVFGALCGAMVTTAALSETAYFLEFRLYRAVKLMQLIPICVYVLGYLLVLLPERLGIDGILREKTGKWNRLRRWFDRELDHPIKLRTVVWIGIAVALIGVAGVGGLYYISRTGNAQSGISALELMFRNVLENRLLVRPRTKEFLIGVPCLMLFVYFCRRGWRLLPFFVGLGMAIGMTSFVNTFLHLRAPLYLSFVRTGYAVLFGLILGTLVIAFFEIVRAIRRKGREKRV